MLVALRSLWEEIYPIGEQYHFTGMLALGGAPYVGESVVETPPQPAGGRVTRPINRRRNRDFDSEPLALRRIPDWKPEPRQEPLVNDDDEILALLAA